MGIGFRLVDNNEITRAFAWHKAFAKANEAIYPRNRQTFSDLICDRCVWCAHTSDDEYLAMSYAAFDDPEHQWEIGGLMVSEAARGKGIGSTMMRLPLASMLVEEQPLSWKPPPAIVTHVLAGNSAPRRIISEIGFLHHKKVEIPSVNLPGLKADDDGFVRGDEFHLDTPNAILSLADWCDRWEGTLFDGTEATIDLLEGITIESWATALRGM